MNEDILKLLVVIFALLYFNLKVKSYTSVKNFCLMNIGLILILFSAFLDWTDAIDRFDNTFIIGKYAYMHDVIEDQFTDTPGLALLLFGIFRELRNKKK